MSRSKASPAVGPASTLVSAARTSARVALGDLDVAPENLRHGEPADDDIPNLAETLIAAGQLQPMTVRPGRKSERSHMVLDGRRRLLALRLLLEDGRIDADFPVDVFVETDPARQAAAALLTNTAVPVHVADVIAAIGRMLKGKLSIQTMARALGYAEIEVKRLAALSALPVAALEALKAGRLNLRQARLLARLPDPAERAKLARMARDGHGFQDWRVMEKLDDRQVTANDPRCGLVRAAQYVAAGGRSVTDLFGERPPVLLDPSILTELWTVRARTIAAVFEAEGLTVHVDAGDGVALPDDLEPAGYVYGGALAASDLAAYREARDRYQEAAGLVTNLLAEGPDPTDLDPLLIELVRKRIAMDQRGWSARLATTLVLRPSLETGIAIQCFTPEVLADPEAPDDEAPVGSSQPAPYAEPEAEAPPAQTDGISHVLHAVRTDVATRGLIRALADDPGVALTALIARLFCQVALPGAGPRSGSALAISAAIFEPRDGRVIEVLDGEVRRRVDAHRAAWEASGETVIAWVHGLAHGDKMELLAELTALTLDLREERTTLLRRPARAQAAELSVLCGADIALHWTPDPAYLAAHSKPLLLAMLEAMGDAADPRVAGLKKDALIDWVAERSATRAWAPSVLSWTGVGPADDPEGREASRDGLVDHPPTEASDGVGAFIVTEAGQAVLESMS